MGYNQQSLENTINTMGTLLEFHPIAPWNVDNVDMWSTPYIENGHPTFNTESI